MLVTNSSCRRDFVRGLVRAFARWSGGGRPQSECFPWPRGGWRSHVGLASRVPSRRPLGACDVLSRVPALVDEPRDPRLRGAFTGLAHMTGSWLDSTRSWRVPRSVRSLCSAAALLGLVCSRPPIYRRYRSSWPTRAVGVQIRPDGGPGRRLPRSRVERSAAVATVRSFMRGRGAHIRQAFRR